MDDEVDKMNQDCDNTAAPAPDLPSPSALASPISPDPSVVDGRPAAPGAPPSPSVSAARVGGEEHLRPTTTPAQGTVTTTGSDPESLSSNALGNANSHDAASSSSSTSPSSLPQAGSELQVPAGMSPPGRPVNTSPSPSSSSSASSPPLAPSLSSAPTGGQQEETPLRPRSTIKRRRGTQQPKGILKTPPPPKQGFSFRRDIIQSLNQRLAQQGVNVQVPVPQGSTASAAGSLFSGALKRLSIAAGSFGATSAFATDASVSGSRDQQNYQSQPAGAPLSSPPLSPGSPSAVSYSNVPSSPASPSSSNSTLPFIANAHTAVRGPDPATPPNPTSSTEPLKRVQFAISNMTVTYPISKEAPCAEDATRVRVERAHRQKLLERKGKKWAPEELEKLYLECCKVREETPLAKLRGAFAQASLSTPRQLRTLDLSFVHLTRQSMEPIADLLSVDFGLQKLVLENCELTDDCLKPLIHALLVSGTLPNLSLAGNRKVKNKGWKYVAIFMRRARQLRYLDLSENSISKQGLDNIIQALVKPEARSSPSSGKETVVPPASGPSTPLSLVASPPSTPVSKWDANQSGVDTPADRFASIESGRDGLGRGGLKEEGEVDARVGDGGKLESVSAANGHQKAEDEPRLATARHPSGDTASHASSLPADEAKAVSLKTEAATSEEAVKKDKAALPETEADEYDEEDEKPLIPGAPLLRQVLDQGEDLPSAVISLRLENCGLKTASLEVLAHGIRNSNLRHLSLRRNRIGAMGVVALAVMLKDYPDSASSESLLAAYGPRTSSVPTTPYPARTSNAPRSTGPAFGVATGAAVGSSGATPSSSPAARKAFFDATSGGGGWAQPSPSTLPVRPASPNLPTIPPIVAAPTGRGGSFSSGLDGRLGLSSPRRAENGVGPVEGDLSGQKRSMREEEEVMIAQTRKAQKLLADLPRIGSLLTLDLKSNDIRGGVVYIAQVLKKNRTLKVLNLSDNNIEMHGLIAIAEALKYNNTLETLDMSRNPCCGPGLEGISTLRTAFALNTNLKRLFLNDTNLSSEGAIALAEFLAEASSVIHLDLTENYEIDIAGVMALAASLKMNQSIRCLDLNIPPNDPDFAHLSQEILQCCIRNTELAQARATTKGLKQPIAAPIYKSVVHRAVKEQKDEQERVAAAVAAAAAAQAAQAAEEQGARRRVNGATAERAEELIASAGRARQALLAFLSEEQRRARTGEDREEAKEKGEELVRKTKVVRTKLVNVIGSIQEGKQLEDALAVNDDLEDLAKRMDDLFKKSPTVRVDPPTTLDTRPETVSPRSQAAHLLHEPVIDSSLSSPTFSIGDSDEEDDDDSDGEDSEEEAKENEEEEENERSSSRSLALASSEPGRRGGLRIDMSVVDKTDGRISSPRSPVESMGRAQVSEESEVFRKAKIMGVDEEEEDEEDDGASGTSSDRLNVSGEELKREILEAEVPRSPRPQNVPLEEMEEAEAVAKEDGDGEEVDSPSAL